MSDKEDEEKQTADRRGYLVKVPINLILAVLRPSTEFYSMTCLFLITVIIYMLKTWH